MTVRSVNNLCPSERRRTCREIKRVLASRAPGRYPVTEREMRRLAARIAYRRRATTRFAASCAGLTGLVAALAYCTANVRTELAWCAVFGLWLIVFFAGGAWMVDEWQKWRASR